MTETYYEQKSIEVNFSKELTKTDFVQISIESPEKCEKNQMKNKFRL